MTKKVGIRKETFKDKVYKEMRQKHGLWNPYTFISKMDRSLIKPKDIAMFICKEFKQQFFDDYEIAYKYVQCVLKIKKERLDSQPYDFTPMFNEDRRLSMQAIVKLQRLITDKMNNLYTHKFNELFYVYVDDNDEYLLDGYNNVTVSLKPAMEILRSGYIYWDRERDLKLFFYPYREEAERLVEYKGEVYNPWTGYNNKRTLFIKDVEDAVLKISMGVVKKWKGDILWKHIAET